MKLVARLLLLPIRLAFRLTGLVFHTGRLAGSVPLRVSRRSTRLLGVRGVLGLVGGIAIGLAVAPGPGRELRAKVRARMGGGGSVTDADLAERVAFELEHAPRTWHLTQPAVTVSAGRVILRGEAALDGDRDELARVAGAVPGVAAVDNLVAVVTE
jgi:hypothetical protein